MLTSRWGSRRKLRSNLCTVAEALEPRVVLTISPEEQLFVYLLNWARSDPQAYEERENLPVSLADVAASEPLAVNDSLFASAGFHAEEMANNNYFDHQSQVTGDWPNQMAEDAGYDLPGYFELDNNYIESIAAGNAFSGAQDTIDLLVIDEGVPSLGHRKHLLSIGDFYDQSKEIGVGRGFNLSSLYDYYWAVHATFSNENDVFLTGVVYNDGNNNQRYDLNEGLSGVTVDLGGGLTTTTNAAGGWSIQVTANSAYTVTTSGGSFVGTATSQVDVTSLNRAIDFRSGVTAGVVDFGAGAVVGNEPPENTIPGMPYAAVEDTAFFFNGLSVSDPDAGTANISVAFNVAHGVLNVKTNVSGGLTAGKVTGNGTDTVILTGTITQINATLSDPQGLRYLPALNYNGTDTLEMVSSDLGNTGSGGFKFDTDSVGINIAAVNDAPVNLFASTTFNVITEETVAITGLSFTDVDLGNNSAVITLAVGHGTLTVRTDVIGGLTAGEITGNGTTQVVLTAPRTQLLATLAALNGLSYTSVDGYIGDDVLTFLTSDQGSTGSGGVGIDSDGINIDVQPVPLPPVLTLPDSPVNSLKGKPVVIGTGGTVTDPDTTNFNGAQLFISLTAGSQANDLLYLNKVGAKAGQLNVKKGQVRLGKTVIGTVNGGEGGADLVITFNSSADVNAVQTVMQNAAFRSKKKGLTATPRTVTFELTDPTNAVSNPVTRIVNVSLS